MSYPPPPPLPVAPLAYDSVPRQWRPGIVTAMGVFSIVIACFSGFISLYSSLASVGFMMMSQISMPRIAVQTNVSSTATPGSVATVTVGGFPMDGNDIADGLAEQPRKNVMRVLGSKAALNEQRVRHLEALLKFGGKLIFPSAADGATPENINANITDSDPMPGSGSAPGPHFFVVGTGRIEVYDDHAVFRPDGSNDVVSIVAPDPSVVAATPAPAPMPTTVPFTGPMFKINPLASGASILASLVSLGLAIYLFIIGIMVLRDSPSGGKLHWIYVFLKTPQVILSAVAGWWVAQGFANSITAMVSASGGPTTPMPTGLGSIMATWAVIFSLFALAYPVALIFVLSSRTVKDYYGSLKSGARYS